MTSMLLKGVDLLLHQSDSTHHLLLHTLTSASIPLIHVLPKSSMAGLCLASVGTQLGSQLWVTLVAGPTMLLNMNRTDFGKLQSRLFPKLAMLGTCTSVWAVTSYARCHGNKDHVTLLLTASTLCHLLESYFLFPLNGRLQALLHSTSSSAEESIERKREVGRLFRRCNGVVMFVTGFVVGVNLYFMWKVGTAT